MKFCLACEAALAGTWRCARCGHQPPAHDGLILLAPELADGDPGDAAYLYEDLARAESRHFWFQARLRLILWALRQHFPTADSLLEVGCGTGALLAALRRRLPSCRLVGSDLVVAGLERARTRLAGVELLQMDARRMPFAEEFDLICALDVLEHVAEDELVLERFFRALKPGGGLILTVPQHPFLWSELDRYSGHQRRYRRRELLAKVENEGFELERVTSFVALLLPLLWLSRRTRPADEPDPTRELDISPVLNLLCRAAMRMEYALIRLGVSFPAGGSLLLLARRPR